MNSISHLKAVAALARYRHFGRAADAIGMTQSALSQAIKKIEHTYGVPIFERRNRQVELTTYGEVVNSAAISILERLDQVDREIHLLSSLEKGHLAICSDPYFSANILASALAEVMRDYPALKFSSSSGYWDKAETGLLDDRIDLYLGMPPEVKHPDLEYRDYTVPTPLILCRREHSLCARKTVTLAELIDYTIVTPLPPAWYIRWAQQQVDSLKAPVDVTELILLETDNVAMMKAVASRSDALTAALPEDVAAEVQRGDLHVLKLKNWPSSMQCCVATRRTRALPPSVEQVIARIDLAVESTFRWANTLPSSGKKSRGKKQQPT